MSRLYFLVCFVLLASCGGGSGSGSLTAPVVAPAPSANISLSASTVTFSARRNEAVPNMQSIEVTWTDSSVAEIIAEFADGAAQPAWLSVTKTGISSPVTFDFVPVTTDLEPGDYTVVLNVMARDGARRTLVTESISVTYEVGSPGASNRASQDTILHYGEEIVLVGANVAWSSNTGNWFNRDIGDVDAMGVPRTNLAAFEAHFNTIANAGGNSARIFLHTGASVTPVIEPGGVVSGLSRDLSNAQVVAQLESILDAAWDEGILVTFNLFSFNMVCEFYQPADAKAMLEGQFQSYIDNALTPMVEGVKDHPAMFAWDIFNEPEGMSQPDYFCPSTETVATETVQQVVNQAAAAIHELDPNVKVTSSTHTDLFDDYSNATLTSLTGANINGILDFYSLHWYNTGWQVSPHVTMAGEFAADKPVIIGEYDPDNTGNNGPASQDSLKGLLDLGYKGAWPWSLSTDSVPNITAAITEAAPLSGPVDKAAIELCIQNKPSDCYNF